MLAIIVTLACLYMFYMGWARLCLLCVGTDVCYGLGPIRWLGVDMYVMGWVRMICDGPKCIGKARSMYVGLNLLLVTYVVF